MATVCVQISTCLRSIRSTITPANGVSKNVGICPTKPTIPSSSAGVNPPRLSSPSRSSTGGMRTASDALVGPVADLTIRALHFDTRFRAGTGIDPEVGLTTPNLAEAETNRALIKVARRVVVLADHTKWGVVSLASFATLDEVGVLVTDSLLPADAHAALSGRIGEIVV